MHTKEFDSFSKDIIDCTAYYSQEYEKKDCNSSLSNRRLALNTSKNVSLKDSQSVPVSGCKQVLLNVCKKVSSSGHGGKDCEEKPKNASKQLDCKSGTLESFITHGIYQNRILCFFIVPFAFLIPLCSLNVMLQIYSPAHWCHVPGRPHNVSIETWRNITLPRDKSGRFESCNMRNGSGEIVACKYGWDYDTTYYDETIVTQMDMVCDNRFYYNHLLTIGSTGNLVGSIVFGFICDIVGRKNSIFIALTLSPLLNIFFFHAPTYTLILVARFFASLTYPVNYQLVYILGIEFCSGAQRSHLTVVGSIAFTLGLSCLPLVGYFARDWLILGYITTLPMFLILVIFWFLDESPRWLLSKNRIKEAADVIFKVNTVNRCPNLCERVDLEHRLSIISCVNSSESTDKNNSFFHQLICNYEIRKRTIALIVCWLSNVFLYYGTQLSFQHMVGDPSLNFFLLTIIEIPSNLLGLIFAHRVRRKIFQYINYSCIFIIFLFCCVYYLTDIFPQFFHSVLLMGSKFFGSLSFLVLYMQESEMYPTPFRGAGIGFCNMIGISAGCITPYILSLGYYHPVYPSVWFLISSVTALAAISVLPETRDIILPETANFDYFK